jgi:hypothetical protein
LVSDWSSDVCSSDLYHTSKSEQSVGLLYLYIYAKYIEGQ